MLEQAADEIERLADELAVQRETSTAALLAERDRLRAALGRIQKWDCLNPPRADLLGDLPWLRRLVDEALAGAADETPGGHSPPESAGAGGQRHPIEAALGKSDG